MRIAQAPQLLDVMHQAVQVPLRAYFGNAAQREAAHTLVVPDVGEHRLHGAHALAVKTPARRVNAQMRSLSFFIVELV